MKTFKSVVQFQKHFDTDAKCRAALEQTRWGGVPCCPYCASINVCRFANGKVFKCREKQCRKQFTVLIGTVAESTKIPLPKWFLAMYILSNHSKGISSLQLAQWLGVTQKTAWFLNHRIREMLTNRKATLLRGVVEVDETYVGGKLSNKHAKQRAKLEALDNKTMVFGAVQRDGKVQTQIVPDTSKDSLVSAVKANVEQGAIMVSDELGAYKSLSKDYQHVSVNHSAGEYKRGAAHTNTIEGFWSQLKRQIYGIHHFVSPKHLQRYCNEASFRYNAKELAQDERFADALANCEGRLKYQQLISKQ